MISFTINGKKHHYDGNTEAMLLPWLRNVLHITSPKDGCSGEGSCGACTIEVDGKPKLACRTRFKSLDGATIVTTEGLPEDFRTLIGQMFAKHGAVQCGFCTPGFIMRSKKLFQQKQRPSRDEIIKAINPNICRCTGYVKIVEAIELALDKSGQQERGISDAGVGQRWPKYEAVETALGDRPFVDDLFFDGMAYGALRFSDHPKATVLSVDTRDAAGMEGVIRIFTAGDIPGKRYNGLIFDDWPMMVKTGETTRYIGDVVAGVVAESEEVARKAAAAIQVEYKVMEPVCDPEEARKPDAPHVHEGKSNLLETAKITSGDPEKAFQNAAFIAEATIETPFVEHAFLETECAVALPEGSGVHVYSQGQGVYVDRKQVAAILDMEEKDVRVTQISSGGGFGGKEDLTVQGHASLFAYMLNKPVKVHLTRQESIRMHPKRHAIIMDMKLACDQQGRLTALKLRATGDTGAYASVGTKVMERVVGHATGAYVIPNVDIRSDTVYTNNIPTGAMRGFGVPQAVFAIEACVDDLCRKGGFDRWQIRFDNALHDGARTAAGQKLQGVGLRECLQAVKADFQKAKYAGIACAIKNSGVGNAMTDESEVKIEIVNPERVIIHHGWTEMGQGIHTMAIQTLHEETGIDPAIVEVQADTRAGVPTGMTTSSRGTALLGNAILDAAAKIRDDLPFKKNRKRIPQKLTGSVYKGKYVCNWTSKPGDDVEDPKIHFAYGYAAQVVVLNDKGDVSEVIAAHDAGKIMNPTLFEGQVEGSVHMGLGYALKEDLKMQKGVPLSFKYKDLGILRAKEMPPVKVIGVEAKDPHGPYGAKGIGEIGMVPTAAAVANAYAAYDRDMKIRLPVKRGC